jgi:hypothetical protein
MSDLATMILVLGGTFVVGGGLLYFSLMSELRRTDASKRNTAVKATAVMAAMRDADSGAN